MTSPINRPPDVAAVQSARPAPARPALPGFPATSIPAGGPPATPPAAARVDAAAGALVSPELLLLAELERATAPGATGGTAAQPGVRASGVLDSVPLPLTSAALNVYAAVAGSQGRGTQAAFQSQVASSPISPNPLAVSAQAAAALPLRAGELAAALSLQDQAVEKIERQPARRRVARWLGDALPDAVVAYADEKQAQRVAAGTRPDGSSALARMNDPTLAGRLPPGAAEVTIGALSGAIKAPAQAERVDRDEEEAQQNGDRPKRNAHWSVTVEFPALGRCRIEVNCQDRQADIMILTASPLEPGSHAFVRQAVLEAAVLGRLRTELRIIAGARPSVPGTPP